MKNPSQSHPHAKWLARVFITSAILITGYAGMQLAPLVHAPTSGNSQHTQLADTCPPGSGHC